MRMRGRLVPFRRPSDGRGLARHPTETPSRDASLRRDDGKALRVGVALTAALLLAACGDQQALTPRAGHSLPPKPATAAVQPTVDQLLAPTAQQRPGRSDELLVRSQARRDDMFDLPPQ